MDTPVREELFGSAHRAVTFGIVLMISLFAFEAMGVGTAMPALVRDLGAIDLYAWPFVAFLASTVFGTAVAGRFCDTRGPGTMLVTAPAVFGIGLVIAGTAGSMVQLLVGRLTQGLGAGAAGVAVYVVVAQVYDESARPAVFALISSAWVLPSLIGPPVSGFVTDHASWHWVFLGLLPLVLVALLLVLPARGSLGPPQQPAPSRRGLVPAAAGAAIGVSALSWSSHRPDLVGVAVAVAALLLLAPAVPRLVPRGTLVGARGIGAVVASRALLSGAFFSATSYLPLGLTRTHGWSLTAAGVPLVVGSVGWSLAAAWQGRHPSLSRPRLLAAGFAGVGCGLAGLCIAMPEWGLAWLSVPLSFLMGLGMGLAFASISILLLRASTAADVGFNTSSAQLIDQLSQAVFISLGGALLGSTGRIPLALDLLLVVLAGLCVVGAMLSRRTIG